MGFANQRIKVQAIKDIFCVSTSRPHIKYIKEAKMKRGGAKLSVKVETVVKTVCAAH